MQSKDKKQLKRAKRKRFFLVTGIIMLILGLVLFIVFSIFEALPDSIFSELGDFNFWLMMVGLSIAGSGNILLLISRYYSNPKE